MREFFKELISTNNNNSQIDIYINDYIALQIYKASAIFSWKLEEVIVNDMNGVGIIISFNDEKDNNKDNFNRFMNSDYYANSVKLKGDLYGSYLILLPKLRKFKYVRITKSILHSIYEILKEDLVAIKYVSYDV